MKLTHVKDEHIKKLCQEIPLQKLPVILECISARVEWTIDEQCRDGTEKVIHACHELNDIALLFEAVFGKRDFENKEGM